MSKETIDEKKKCPICGRTEGQVSFQPDNNDKPDPPNNGILIMDTTCAPANITYPQDIKLCNEARVKTEQMIETMHERGNGEKSRLDKKKDRREYLKAAKSKKRVGNATRKASKKQLSYIRRNLGYIDGLMEHYAKLSTKQKAELETIRTLYEQQKYMTRFKHIATAA